MALHLVLDGYNVIGALQYGSMFGGDWEARREMLIEDLRRYKRTKGFRITVVFDGQNTREVNPRSETYKGIRVIFTRGREKADDFIVRMVRKSSSGIVVVSCDREVAEQCQRLGASVISAVEFGGRMESEVSAAMKGIDEQEEEDQTPALSTQKKGPSQRLSRRRRQDKKRFRRL
jgi:predicted RNA-binding protein with PIN domain